MNKDSYVFVPHSSESVKYDDEVDESEHMEREDRLKQKKEIKSKLSKIRDSMRNTIAKVRR